MLETHHLLLFFAAALLLGITPGPGIFYVLDRSFAGGKREGIHSSCGTVVVRLFHVSAAALGLSAILAASAVSVFPVESGFGTPVVEMGIGGLILWLIMSFAIILSAWRVVKQLRGSPWFPTTYAGIASYQDFVMNAYLWLLLGILFRLPTLAISAQFAAVQPGAPVEHFFQPSVQQPFHQPWMR